LVEIRWLHWTKRSDGGDKADAGGVVNDGFR
jgi:hypothetical protein